MAEEMKLYVGTKIIRARLMDELTFLTQVKGQTIEDTFVSREGYEVEYPDKYLSWSPKEAFEGAYREISLNEMHLIQSEGR